MNTATEVLTRFHEQLARDIREDLSGVVEFEKTNDLVPYFLRYYTNWQGDERRLRRTMNGAIERRRYLPDFVEQLKSKFGAHPRVLDVGCGFGSDALLITWLGCEVFGVVPDPRKVAISAHRAQQWRPFLGEDAPHPRFAAGRLEDLTDLAPASFDAAFTSECLHHCEPVENTLLAIRGLVRESGRVFVLESNGACPANEILLRKRRSKDQRRRLVRRDERFELVGVENIHATRTWVRLFRECGFDVESTRYSRHLLSEATAGTTSSDQFLCRLPGKSVAAIHVTFVLAPRPFDDSSV